MNGELPNFKSEIIKALEMDLENIKQGKYLLAEKYTDVLERDILYGINKRQKEREGGVI